MTTLTQPATLLTPEEYLAAEREAETRSEYVDRVVYPMTGAQINHVKIVTNLIIELGLQFRGRQYSVLAVDMKVRMPDSRKYFYPDIVIVGDDPQFHDDRKDIILNPVLLIEVLSKSTESFDRGLKFQAYQQVPSLREYLLVAQDEPSVEQYVKQDDGTWKYKAVAGREASLALPSVGCTLNLGTVYDKVDWTD